MLERHAEEAAALWPRRERASLAADHALGDLARLDGRIEAHLDGLRLAGRDGSRAAAELGVEQPGSFFAQVAQALDRRDAKALAALLDALEAAPALAEPLVGALAWIPIERSTWAVRALLDESCPPALRRFGLAAHLAHRSDPGLPLLSALGAHSAPLRAAALEGVGLLGRLDLVRDVAADLDSPSPACRRAARLTAALLGDERAATLVWEEVEPTTPSGRAALVVAVARTAPDDAAMRLDAWRNNPARWREGVEGIGLLGQGRRVPWLLEAMRSPELARLAGEAFTRITGVAIRGPLRAPAPPDAPGPNDDPADPKVDDDPDAALPWPDPAAVERAWTETRGALPAGRRLLFGAPIDADRCAQLSRTASQRVRVALALEAAALAPGSPVAPVRGPGFRQLAGAR